ncbi:MAG TPA: hypothetical protein VND93_08095 [Myxococcales bacterium]|jgi:hypothetical protein|nr:hypothetical protein [Myxococcales bacterium]
MIIETPPGPRATPAELSNVFIPFAALLAAALLVPELGPGLVRQRAVFTIWVAMAFMTPALGLYFWPGEAPAKERYWRLLWTAGFLAYAAHFCFTVGAMFHWSLREVYAAQRPVIATSNLLDSAWWAADVALAWAFTDAPRWVKVQRTAAHVYIPATFFVSAVLLKHGFARGLGITMTAVLVAGLYARARARWAAPRPESVTSLSGAR